MSGLASRCLDAHASACGCENTADVYPGEKVVITFVTKIGSLLLALFLSKSKSV